MRNEHAILIITAHGAGYGSGHLSRMRTLSAAFSERGLSVQLHCGDGAQHASLQPDLYGQYSCIIRDMRDSAADEINTLKKHGPVIVLDDLGTGRDSADSALDFLPGPESAFRPDTFLCGAAFMEWVRNAPPLVRKERIAATYVPGAPESLNNDLRATIPGLEIVSFPDAGISFPATIAGAGCLLTHFGISCLEAHLLGTPLVAISPGPYHRTLAIHAAELLNIRDAGLLSHAEVSGIARHIASAFAEAPEICDIETARSKAQRALDNCVSAIRTEVGL
jgi:hypothetical protein